MHTRKEKVNIACAKQRSISEIITTQVSRPWPHGGSPREILCACDALSRFARRSRYPRASTCASSLTYIYTFQFQPPLCEHKLGTFMAAIIELINKENTPMKKKYLFFTLYQLLLDYYQNQTYSMYRNLSIFFLEWGQYCNVKYLSRIVFLNNLQKYSF